MLKAFKLIGFRPPKRWDYSLWRNSIPEVQIYTKVDHGSWVTYTMGQMGHGSRKVTHGPLRSTPQSGPIFQFL